MDYRVGIIDDDGTKVTQFMNFIPMGWSDEKGRLVKEN